MISAVNNSPTFTSVVPVRVFIDGLETFDEKMIKSSLRVAKSSKNFLDEFAKHDKDAPVGKIKNFSDFFRCIFRHGQALLFTGPQAQKLQHFGKAISQERVACKNRGITNSFDLVVAKRNYANAINDFASNAKFRIFKDKKPATLHMNMKSNGKYGKTTFKITNVENIEFLT